MKGIKLISTIAALMLTTVVFSQSVDVEWGPYFELEKKTQFDKVAGFDKNVFYMVRMEKSVTYQQSKLWLDKFSTATMQQESSVEFKPPMIYTRDAFYESLFYLNGKLILFSSLVDNVKNRRTLYAQYIDDNGTLEGNPKMIGETSFVPGEASGYEFTRTSDNSKILVQYHVPFKVYGNEPFAFKLIDSELNVSFSKDIVFPLTGRSFNVSQYAVGNSGNLYFSVCAVPVTKKKTQKNQRQSNEWTVYVYNVKKEELKPYPLVIEKFKPVDLTFALDNTENIIMYGFYTKKSGVEFNGMYYQKINPRTEKVEGTHTKDFSKDRNFVAQFKLERNGENAEQFYSYNLGKIEFLDNGSSVFLTEQYYETGRTIVEPRTKKETIVNYYNYNDIIAASVNSDNKFEWVTRVPKCQFSTNDDGYYSSFATTNYSNKVKVVFNDHPKNIRNTDPAKTKQIKNNVATNPEGVTAVVTIFPDGNTDKALLFGEDEEKTSTNPKFFFNVGNEYIIYGEKGNMSIPLAQKYKWGNFFFE